VIFIFRLRFICPERIKKQLRALELKIPLVARFLIAYRESVHRWI